MSVFRHERASEKHELDSAGAVNLDAITGHAEKFWGPVETVFHEIISEYVHLDVLFVAPTAARPFRKLVTSGMSDRPMTAPLDGEKFAELVISLPADWPVDETSRKEDRHYWPIRQLKYLARFSSRVRHLACLRSHCAERRSPRAIRREHAVLLFAYL